MEATNKQESLSTKYKNLFIRTRNLIVSPKTEWEEIHKEKSDINYILAGHVLPYIGALSLITFVSYIASHHNYPFESALKLALSQFASFFFGLHIAYFITLNIIPKFTIKTNTKDLKQLAFKITAYCSTVLYLIKIVIALVPQIYYLQVVGIYVVYLAYLGTKNMGTFESRDMRIVFTVIVSTLLLFVPYFISVVFMKFIGI